MSNNSLIIKPKKQKGEDGYKIFSIRIKEEVVAQMEDMSIRTGRSRNEIVGLLLEYAIKNCIIEGESIKKYNKFQ